MMSAHRGILGILLWNSFGFTWGFCSTIRTPQIKQLVLQGLLSGAESDSSTYSDSDRPLVDDAKSLWSLGSSTRSKRTQYHDAVIVGGGLAGLSTALFLSQLDPDRHITILERELPSDRKTVASFAAAGMLAPQSERLPAGFLLDLCTTSRRM
jgi:hypothetical protein